MNDPVNQPAHYTSHPSGVECIELTQHMSFCVGNAFKYVFRAPYKGNPVQDYEKALWYIAREQKVPGPSSGKLLDIKLLEKVSSDTGANAFALWCLGRYAQTLRPSFLVDADLAIVSAIAVEMSSEQS